MKEGTKTVGSLINSIGRALGESVQLDSLMSLQLLPSQKKKGQKKICLAASPDGKV